jgi:hypothetical protein
MAGPALLYSAVFGLYCLMEVLGLMPQEVRSAGLTLPALFSSLYGDQSVDFVGYHVRRTTVSLLVHLQLPLVYCLGLGLVQPEWSMFDPWTISLPLSLLWCASFGVSLTGIAIAMLWYPGGWKGHPLMKTLSRTGQPPRIAASSVNLEYRDIDKFVAPLGGSVVIVTDSWILQTNVHAVDIIHQRDAVLHVASSQEHSLTAEGSSAQFLTITVQSINPRVYKSFMIRLNSLQYSQLTDRLMSPIRVARSVVIHQSIADRFSVAFRDQVERNGTYTQPPGSPVLDPCVGCLQARPEVKLSKQCESDQCRQCFCRPMWCMSCMSKWYSARQDQYRLETWMTGTAPCPMCRAPFCMLDILSLTPDS